MTRPLRVDVEGGWYHTTCRGIHQGPIWEEDADRRLFQDLLEQMVERFQVRNWRGSAGMNPKAVAAAG